MITIKEEVEKRTKELEKRTKELEKMEEEFYFILKFIGILSLIVLVSSVYIILYTGGLKLLMAILFSPIYTFWCLLKDILF